MKEGQGCPGLNRMVPPFALRTRGGMTRAGRREECGCWEVPGRSLRACRWRRGSASAVLLFHIVKWEIIECFVLAQGEEMMVTDGTSVICQL